MPFHAFNGVVTLKRLALTLRGESNRAFHAFNGVVTLKLFALAGRTFRLRAFHAFNGVVTLKLINFRPMNPDSPIPRLQRRGHIEACWENVLF